MKTLGILLAGGKSARMGKDKSNLIWKQRPLIKFQLETLSKVVGYQNIIISGERTEHNSIHDFVAHRGPVEGLHSVIKKISDDYSRILVIPVDMPLLTARLLKQLVNKTSKRDAIKFHGFQLPVLFQNYSKLKSILTEMEADLLESGFNARYSFVTLYKKLEIEEISSVESDLLINTNTPDEWTHAISKANFTTRT